MLPAKFYEFPPNTAIPPHPQDCDMNYCWATFGDVAISRLIAAICRFARVKGKRAVHIISPGSGRGLFEYRLCAMLSHIGFKFVRVTCIDPNEKTVFLRKGLEPVIKHHYPLIDDVPAFSKERGVLAVLLLNWCPPDLKFDAEAIIKFRGVDIIYSLYERMVDIGSAGSPSFHSWRRAQKEYYAEKPIESPYSKDDNAIFQIDQLHTGILETVKRNPSIADKDIYKEVFHLKNASMGNDDLFNTICAQICKAVKERRDKEYIEEMKKYTKMPCFVALGLWVSFSQ